MSSTTAATRSPRTWKKRLTVSAVSFVVLLVVLELGARVGSWLWHDRNPYYLFYGFVSWTSDEGDGHSDKRAGYFKFPPGEEIRHGLPEPGHINAHGFRGAEFEAAKPAGTFRVVCMGGSSTFGYTNRDAETYPALLQDRFDADEHERRVEVINAGIPHFDTGHLAALLEREALDWTPDVLTLYEAYNDALRPLAETRVQRWTRAVDEYSAAFATLRKVLNERLGDVLYHRWSAYPRMTREKLDRQVALHREATRANLERIHALAGARGVALVVVRQPMTLWPVRVEHGLASGPRPPLAYEDEVAEVRARFESEGALPGWEAVLLVHRAVLDEIDAFAARHALPVVDNVALVDAHADAFSSYVHLTAGANARLAEALHATLAPLVPAP